MNRFFKYGVIPVVIFIFLFIFTIILLPVFINIQKFVPDIEKEISKSINRPFSLGPDLGITFFPWLSLTFSDMKIGNPPGFSQENFVKIRSFEARVDLLPLLKKRIQFSRFVVGGLNIRMERNAEAQENWHICGAKGGGRETDSLGDLIFALFKENLGFTLLGVTDGQLQILDQKKNENRMITDIMFVANDVAATHPVTFEAKAALSGRQLTVEGKVGPVVGNDNKRQLPLDLAFNLMGRKMQGQIKGSMQQQGKVLSYACTCHLGPFNFRELVSGSEWEYLVAKAESNALQSIELQGKINGNDQAVALENGSIRIDESNLKISANVDGLPNPQWQFTIDGDDLDLDRYWHFSKENAESSQDTNLQKDDETTAGEKNFNIPAAVINGSIQLAEVHLLNGKLSDFKASLSGKDNVISIAPVTFKTNNGLVEGTITVDLRDPQPLAQARFKIADAESAGLLKDYFGYEVLQGKIAVEGEIASKGKSALQLRNNLHGDMALGMQEGFLLGIAKSSIEWDGTTPPAEKSEGTAAEQAIIPFNEAKGHLLVTGSVLTLQDTMVTAPNLLLQYNGVIDLQKELLNLKIEAEYKAELSSVSDKTKPTPLRSKTPPANKRGHQEQVERKAQLSITGAFSAPELKNQQNPAVNLPIGTEASVKKLVAQKVAAPNDEEVKNLVGKDLVDPAVVAERFGLQVETLRKTNEKKKFTIGSGKVMIKPLLENSADM